MTKMNSIHCSKLTVSLLTLVLLFAAVAPAAAFESSAEGLPSEATVGDEVTITYTIDGPFTDVPDEWTLRGETELESVGWTVTTFRADNQLEEDVYGTQTFERDLSIDSNADQVRIEVTGEVPAVENYTYAERETFVAASLSRVTGSNTQEFTNDSVHHYTEESSEARTAIEEAEATIDESGGNEDAENLLQRSKSAYNAGNFENAVALAEDARSEAESAQQSQRTMRTIAIVAGAVVVLALLGGGIYYWRSQQDEYSKL